MQYRYGLVAVCLVSMHITAQSPYWQHVKDSNSIKQKCLQSNGNDHDCSDVERFFEKMAKEGQNNRLEYQRIQDHHTPHTLTIESLEDSRALEFLTTQFAPIFKILKQRVKNRLHDTDALEVNVMAPLLIAATAMGSNRLERKIIAKQLVEALIIMTRQQIEEMPAENSAIN